MKTNNIKVLCVAVFAGAALNVTAQEDKTKELNREMTLEREFDPTVQDANKVNTLPEVKEPVVNKIPIDFSNYTTMMSPDKELTVLPSGQIGTNIPFNKRRGYFNIGAGTYMNINGDLGYHILSTEKDRLGIWFSHRSTNGNVKYLQIDEKQKAKINDNIGGLNFKHLFTKTILDLGVKYGYSSFNYYGLPWLSELDNDNLSTALPSIDRENKQGDQTVGLNLGFHAREEKGFLYNFNLGYTNFSRKYGILSDMDGLKENTVDVDFGLSAGFNSDMRIGLDGNIDYSAYSTLMYEDYDVYSYQGSLGVTLSPYLKAEGDIWDIKIGAKLLYSHYEDNKISAAPNIAANVTVADKTQLYLKADGGILANNAYEISKINRYVNPVLGIMPSINNLDATIGLKSGVAPGFWFDIYGGYNITKDDVFFGASYYETSELEIVTPAFYSVCEPIQLDSKRFFVGVNLKYSYQDIVDLGLKGQYNGYTITMKEIDEETNVSSKDLGLKPFGRPQAEITANITLRPIKNLSASLDYYIGANRYSNVYDNNGFEKMKNINELNLTGNYNLNDTFGIYLKLTNVLCQKYDLYYGYPAQSFGAMVGFNLNF